MSLFDNFDIFPVLRTKRIIIGKNSAASLPQGAEFVWDNASLSWTIPVPPPDKVSVQALLSTRDNNNVSSWLGSSRFKEYIKVFFMVVPESNISSMRRMRNPETRFSSQDDLALLREHYDMTEISLSEILQRDYIGSVSEMDILKWK